MKIINLGETDSLLNRFVAELRDRTIQKDTLRFRRNLERVGEIFAYEISKTLRYSEKEVETPLGIASCRLNSEDIVLSTLLRAGLPLHQGFLNYFDKAPSAFIAAYRKYTSGGRFNLQLEYSTCPATEGKILVITDPMIATGSSLDLAYRKLIENGEPAHTHIVSVIASAAGVDYLAKNLPHNRVTLWVAAIDEELTNRSYIIPGLGDAGDLAFGEK